MFIPKMPKSILSARVFTKKLKRKHGRVRILDRLKRGSLLRLFRNII